MVLLFVHVIWIMITGQPVSISNFPAPSQCHGAFIANPGMSEFECTFMMIPFMTYLW